MNKESVILDTAYWPNLHYFFYLINAPEIIIDQYVNYEKQSFRTRTNILSANGPLTLSIPVVKHSGKTPVKDIQISEAEKWRSEHWRAIISAYNNSPFFSFLEEEIAVFYDKPYKYLIDYNMQQLEWLKKVFRIKSQISLSETYIETNQVKDNWLDLRGKIHPKQMIDNKDIEKILAMPYYQTFKEKFDFVPNLSVLDLLFNTGIKLPDQYLV
ncbi:MAG: WbqC family protein [Bacteroidia bacterium]